MQFAISGFAAEIKAAGQRLTPAKKNSNRVLSPRLSFEMSPSARTSKGFSIVATRVAIEAKVQLSREKPTVNLGESCKDFLPLKIAWFKRGFLFLGGIILATSPADVARGSASVALGSRPLASVPVSRPGRK